MLAPWLRRGMLYRWLRPRPVPPYLAGLVRVLLRRPAWTLRDHWPYRLHGAERREPFVGVHVGIASRVFRRQTRLGPKAFVEQLAGTALVILP